MIIESCSENISNIMAIVVEVWSYQLIAKVFKCWSLPLNAKTWENQ